MKRQAFAYAAAVVSLSTVIAAAAPCRAQLFQKLEQGLLGGQGQGQQGGATLLGNVNLPPAQYMMTNVQTGQAFYVMVQNGQMYLSGQAAPQAMAPGQGMMGQGMMGQNGMGQGMMGQGSMGQGMMQPQQGGMGGIMNGGLGSFIKKEFSGQQGQQQIPNP
jgi:hypothetical protein